MASGLPVTWLERTDDADLATIIDLLDEANPTED